MMRGPLGNDGVLPNSFSIFFSVLSKGMGSKFVSIISTVFTKSAWLEYPSGLETIYGATSLTVPIVFKAATARSKFSLGVPILLPRAKIT